MSDIQLVVDNDFIDKLAKIDQLELLRLENAKIIITDKVLKEIDDGVTKGSPSATKAYEWLTNNQNKPWLEIDVPTKPLPPELAKTLGGGEGSIVSYINEQKTLTPDASYTALTDNIKDAKKITEAINDPSRANVRMVREYTNDLASRSIISADEYTRLEIDMVNRKAFSVPRVETYTIIPDTPNYGSTEIEIVRRKGINVGGKPDTELRDIVNGLNARGYAPTDALDVANAHINSEYSLKEISAGRNPAITKEQLEQSRDLLNKAATDLNGTPQAAALNKQISATNALISGDADLAKSIYTSPPSVPKPDNSFNQAFKRDQADLTAPVPTNSPRVMEQHISAVTQAEHRISTAHQLEKAAAQQAQEAAKLSALTKIPTNPYEPPKGDITPNKGVNLSKSKGGIDIDADDLKMVGKVGKIAKPLAVVAAGYIIYDEVSNAIDKEATTRGKVAAGISTAINATAENVTQGVSSTFGLAEGWVVGGLANNNGIIGGVVGADIGSEVRGEQALNALKNTSFEKTVTEYSTNTVNYVADKAKQAEASFNQAYDGSALQKNVNQARSTTNALLNEANQNLEQWGKQAKQVYETSDIKPYIDNTNQYVYQKAGEASDFAKRNVNDAVNYVDEQGQKLTAWGEDKWNELKQTPVGQRVIGNLTNTVAEAKKDAYQYYEVRDPAEVAREQQREANRVNPNAAPAQPIELGSNHQDKKSTKAVQQLLNAAGYGVRVTGSYDSQTEQAVRRFQHKQHLPEDGTMGGNDFKVLAKTAQNHQHNLAVQRERNVQLQHKLGVLGFEVNITGKMDKQTAHAIREFEQAFGLDVNGKLTPKEQKVLTQAFNEKTTQQTQAALSQLGYEVKVTGQMDEATKNAITQYETDHGLKKNGVLEGNETTHLYKTAQKNFNLINEHGGLMAVGTHHSNVGAVQKALGDLGYDVPVTNYFGQKTEAALKQFQERNGLTVDGVFKQADFERIDQLISAKEQSITPTQPITIPANQPDAVTPTVSPEQSKQVEQMVSALSTNPTFAALAPDVQMTMAAQMMEAAKSVNLQPQTQTVTPQVQTAPEPVTQTVVPTMMQAEPQPVMATPVQSSPVDAAPAMTAPTAATAEVEPPARQTDATLQSTQPIVLPRNLASLHAQLTEKFGNQLDHLSEKDQQTTIALATLEAAKFNVRTVDQIFISPKGDVLMSFDQQRTCSGDINLAQVPQYDANQVLAETINLQQSQQQAIAQRQSQSQGGPTMTM